MFILFALVASLSALTSAAPSHIDKWQDPAIIASVFSRISSVGADLLPPPTLIPQLMEIPSSVASGIFNTALQSSLAREFLNPNGPPAWYTSLSPDAKAYILGIPGKEATIIPQIISIEVVAGFSSLILPPAPATVVATTTDSTSSRSTGSPDISTSSDLASLESITASTDTTRIRSLTSLSPSFSSSSSTTPTTSIFRGTTVTSSRSSSSISSNMGNAQVTGVTAGLVGAIGFLGLAIAL